jgi:peptidoglycan-associated lipoprotein
MVAATASLGACKTVSPDELEAGLSELRAELREEMADGDARVSEEAAGRDAETARRIEAMESEFADLAREFEVSIQRLEDELRFDVPIYFDFDDATLDSNDESLLDRFGAVALGYYPGALVTVEGFTDPSGDAAYNLALGQRRADAVARYLVEGAGLPGDRTRAVSYGEDIARLVDAGAEGPGVRGWENRRVVLVIDHHGAAPASPPVAGASD